MKIKILLSLLICCFSFPAFADGLEEYKKVKQYCHIKWQSDYSMVEYCINEQSEAAFKFFDAFGSYPKDHECRNIMADCCIKWKKDGFTDWAMVDYCSKEQIGAYKRLQH